MLNKEVCMKCFTTTYHVRNHWGEADDKMWEDDKQIRCVEIDKKRSAPMYIPPPISIYDIDQVKNDCPNFLEHLVAERQDEIDKKEKLKVQT